MDSQASQIRKHDVIAEFHHNAMVVVHHVMIPNYDDDGWYITMGSLSGFHNRCLKRLVKHQERVRNGKTRGLYPPLYFVHHRARDIEERTGFMDMICQQWDECTNHDYHKNIFDFYRAVGIDYKRDKWPTLEQREHVNVG